MEFGGMSLDDIFRDAETLNPEEAEDGKQRHFPLDRNRACLSDPNYFLRPPPKQLKPEPALAIPQATNSAKLPNYSGVRRTIIRNTSMLRYLLGEHLPGLLKKTRVDDFGGCGGRCGVGEGRIRVNDELKDLARKANVFGDKKPDNFAVLSYVSELLSGSLKMILKADHAVQYLAAGNFDVCDPSGKRSLKNDRKSGSSPSSVNEKTVTSGGSTSPVPFPSEADMSDDIDQLLTWIADSAKSLDQLETPRIEETVFEPMIDFDALLAETIAERRSEKSEVRNEPLLETQSQVGTSRQPSISSSVNSPPSEVGVVIVAVPEKEKPDEGRKMSNSVVENKKRDYDAQVPSSSGESPVDKVKQVLQVSVDRPKKTPEKKAGTPASFKVSPDEVHEVAAVPKTTSSVKKSIPATPAVSKPELGAISTISMPKAPRSGDTTGLSPAEPRPEEVFPTPSSSNKSGGVGPFIEKLCALRKAAKRGNLTVFNPAESPKSGDKRQSTSLPLPASEPKKPKRVNSRSEAAEECNVITIE